MIARRPLALAEIIKMSFGFLGIQFGWGLQMANMSAIYQYLGASESEIPLLWLAAPVTGLIVQPIVGYYSDRTWTRLGRRRPYFLVGAILASFALLAMPNSSTLWMAAGLLWVLDASVNISMEPFRAFVGDLLPPEQRKVGFAMQSLLIGLGAILSSALPWLLTNVFGMAPGTASADSPIPLVVHVSFYIGAVVFITAVLYTVLTTPEHPPADLAAFEREKAASAGAWHAVVEIFRGLRDTPPIMRRLAVVQFFTWLGLFCLWIYFAPAIARSLFGGTPGSPEYQRGVEWGGVCFATYNGVAFAFSFALIPLARRYSARAIHRACLTAAALGLLAVGVWQHPTLLLISMLGVGIGWASILSMPYALLANVIPPARMGFYMGVFNFFIVLPQIVASAGLGFVVAHGFGGQALYAVLLGGASLVIAALALSLVPPDHVPVPADA
ncbi:MFS transporter [Opitutus terrae]|uniref:Major facilitator superfamily MFS_1 n=1 Tax=Opitutus terrae (strain DSM 11246 / JCM 15787 / PB90-1) TaxID=452637 RepID=B1ZWM5_OPITP|nr:MFS transporter [Opitutus terrae]ACB74152.1 major facilitator superfamily MFS_1 [Opitutus terrae PB90-1]